MLDVEQVMLAESFRTLLEREREATAMYADLIARTADATTLQQLKEILREKQRHVGLGERLLEIVE